MGAKQHHRKSGAKEKQQLNHGCFNHVQFTCHSTILSTFQLDGAPTRQGNSSTRTTWVDKFRIQSREKAIWGGSLKVHVFTNARVRGSSNGKICKMQFTNGTKVQVGNDQDKAQSERDSLSKNRGVKKNIINNQVLIP